MRICSGLLLVLAISLPLTGLLAGCAMLDNTPPERRPSVIAAGYVGKPLLDLEMHWSAPWSMSSAGGGQAATWRFDQFNMAGCTVTVHADTNGIIRRVKWTRGCGPKGTGSVAAAGGFDSP